MQKVIESSNLVKKIGKKTIVDHISMDIYAGEVFGLLGPNGAGKTTTIKAMVGLVSLTEGSIRIKQKCITKDFEAAIRHVGAIVENPVFYKQMSGYQNLLMFSKAYSSISKARIMEVAQIAQIADRIHDKVKAYSLGMRQRLGIAQALLHSPDVLILDEPMNGLDPQGIHDLRKCIRMLAQEQGVGVMISSHILSEMELMCDRFAIMQQGKLLDIKLGKEKQGTNQEQVKVNIDAQPYEKVKDILKTLDYVSNICLKKDSITFDTLKENIPKTNKAMVENDISIFGLKIEERSLESIFIEATGGNMDE